jgi:filamin
VDQEFEFFVESNIEPVAEILGPARRIVAVSVEEILSRNGYNVKFTPVDVGDHSVEVRLPANGGHVEGSPFLLKAYSAEKVIVADIKSGTVGKSVSFSINASQAGAGNLEIIVAVGGKNVPNFVTSEGNARFKVNFKPTEAAKHSLSVRFNGLPVPGSPFNCVISPQQVSTMKAMASGEALRQAPVNIDNVFELEGFDAVEPQIYITSPAGESVPCKLTHREDLWLVTFKPIVVGRHLIRYAIFPFQRSRDIIFCSIPVFQVVNSTSQVRRSAATFSMFHASPSADWIKCRQLRWAFQLRLALMRLVLEKELWSS